MSVHRRAASWVALVLTFAWLVSPTSAYAAPTPAPEPVPAPRAAAAGVLEPTWNDLESSITIPEVPGVEYVVDGVVTAPGTHTYTIPFGGQYKTVVARGAAGAATPAPQTWKHRFPEVVEMAPPTWDDAGLRVLTGMRSGVQSFVAGANNDQPLKAGTWIALTEFEGKTACLDVRAAVPAVTLLKGQTQWCHTFPAKPQAPVFDDLASSITIPDVVGVEYLIDNVVTAPGTHTYTIPFGGQYKTVVARGTNNNPVPTPQTWKHRFPEVVEMPAPVWNDEKLWVQTASRSGVQSFIPQVSDQPQKAASVVLLNQFEGQTVCLEVRAAAPTVTLLKGQTEWCHTFPAKPQAPTFDNLTSTITIPDVAGASYQVDGQPVAPGTITLKVPFGGQWVTVTATGQGSPTVYTWKNRFPEVVTPTAPVFDDGQQRLTTPINKGVYWYIDGYNDGKPLVAGNTVDMSAYAGQTIRMYAVAAVPAVTLLTGQTEWFHTFPARPDHSIANGDEFDGEGLSKYWRIYTQDTPANRKSLYRPESVSVHDGVLDMRTRRHCIADEREKLTDANATTAVCPAGKITRYSTGRVDTNYIYGMPARVEVRARLDPDHHGITSTGWMHNDQPFCNNGVTTTDIAEMDIMEVWATNYSKTFSHITCDNGNYHTNGVETHQWIPGDWHTWAVEWDGHALRYYFDGKQQTGPYGPEITAQTLGITQERFLSAMHDHMWQFVINVTAPVDGGWAPWIDDTLPFRDRHDLYDYVRIQPFVQMDCQPYGLIGEYAARHPELGRSTGCEYAAGVPGSRAQNFEHGRVYWSPATGAQPVSGAVLDKFLRSGGERQMGLPTNPPLAIRDGGTSQTFQTVTILHSPATGAHWVRGLIRDKYAQTGWENGPLGYPVTDEVCGLRDNGCYQRFQFDDHIYWSAGTGAHSVLGAIYQKYASMGWENGDFGYPTSDEICGLRDGGCVQRFQHANGHIYWSPATGAHFTRGLIQDRYGAMGWENSTIGYPVTDEICGIRDGGCYQRFQRESGHLYWSPASGSWGVQGAIFAHWGSTGWENGRLGYPTGPERCANRPGALECDQDFQRGRITWSSAHGARG